MRKIRILVYLFGSALLLHGCSSRNVNPPPVHFVEDEYMDKVHAAGGDTMPHVYTVTIAQMKFDPAVLKVKKGDTVVFNNQDIVTHDITEVNKKWNSKLLPANESWKMAVTGSADYFCTIHPMMKGSIVMQ